MSELPVIIPPIGDKKRGRPRSSTRPSTCALMAVSLRSLERGIRVRSLVIPEIVEWIEQRKFSLGPAEYLTGLSVEDQKWVVQQGPKMARQIANQIRRDIELERRARRLAEESP